jgi:hypothetical protein
VVSLAVTGAARADGQGSTLADSVGRFGVPARPACIADNSVIRFRALARTSTGAAVEGLATNWSFAPGSGTIAHDGSFAAFEPGDYVITAVQGNRTAQSVLRVGRATCGAPCRWSAACRGHGFAPRNSGSTPTGSTPSWDRAAAVM